LDIPLLLLHQLPSWLVQESHHSQHL
jgi:hypothetical protein